MEIQGNYYIKAGLPSEPKYLNESVQSYSSVAEFIARVPVVERHDGLTFKVESTEYWLDGGVTDAFIQIKTEVNYRLIAYNGESFLNIDCRKRRVGKFLINGVGLATHNFGISFNNLPNQSFTDLEFHLFIPNMAKGATINFSATLAADKQVDIIDVSLQQPGLFKCPETGSYFLIIRYTGNFVTVKREGPFGLTTRAHLHVDPNKSTLIYIDEYFNKIPFAIDDPFIVGGRNIRASDFFTLQFDQPVGSDPVGVESGRGNGIVFNGTYDGGFASFRMGFQQIQELYIDLYLSANAKWWFGCIDDGDDVFDTPQYMFIGANLNGEVVDWPINGDIHAQGDAAAHLVSTDTGADGAYRIRISRVFNQNNFQVYVNDVLATSFNITDTNPTIKVGFRTFSDFISIKRLWIKYLDPIEYYTQQEITSVPDVDPGTVKYGTPFSELLDTLLPTTVTVTLEDASTRDLAVNWNAADYNATTLGVHTITGEFVITPDLINPGFSYEVDITVEPFVIIASITPEAADVPYNFALADAIELAGPNGTFVLDAPFNGSDEYEVVANWSGEGTYDSSIIGTSTLVGLPTLPPYITNPTPEDLRYFFNILTPLEVASVESPDDITVPTGTPFNSIGLPTQLLVTYDNASTQMLDIIWDENDYDPGVEATNVISGTIVLPATGVANFSGIEAFINVIVEETSSSVVIPDLTFGVEAVGTYSFTGDELNPPPVADGIVISGTPAPGNTLTASFVNLRFPNGATAGSHVYRWYRATSVQQAAESLISGATAATYLVTIDDDGKYLRVEAEPKQANSTGQNLTGATVKSVYTTQVNDASFNPFVDIVWYQAHRPSGAANLGVAGHPDAERWVNEGTGDPSARDGANAMPVYNSTLKGVEFTRSLSQRLLLDQPITQYTRPVEIWCRFRMKTVGGGFQRFVAWTGVLYLEVQNDGSLFLAAGDTAVNLVINTWYVCRFVLVGTASASKFQMNNGTTKTDVGANTSGSFGTNNGRIGCASAVSNFSDVIISHLFVRQGELTTDEITNMWSWFSNPANEAEWD